MFTRRCASALALLLALILSACGSNSAPSTQTLTSAATTVSTTAPTVALATTTPPAAAARDNRDWDRLRTAAMQAPGAGTERDRPAPAARAGLSPEWPGRGRSLGRRGRAVVRTAVRQSRTASYDPNRRAMPRRAQ